MKNLTTLKDSYLLFITYSTTLIHYISQGTIVPLGQNL